MLVDFIIPLNFHEIAFDPKGLAALLVRSKIIAFETRRRNNGWTVDLKMRSPICAPATASTERTAHFMVQSIGTRKRCGPFALKTKCTSGAFRFLAIHMDEPARQRARELANTPQFVHAQRQRKKVEALFAELKNQIGLRRLRLRRLKFVREQFFLAAVAQNIKRLMRFLSRPTTPTVEAAA